MLARVNARQGLLRHSVVVLLLSLPVVSNAGGLRVSPLELSVSDQRDTASFTIENLASLPTPAELSVFAWTQEQGDDVLRPTDDILLAPPIVSVPAKGKITIRLRARKLPPEGAEQTYRVYVKELPRPNLGADGTRAGTAFTTKFGIPLYASNGRVAGPELLTRLTRDARGTVLSLENAGATHLRVYGIHAHAEPFKPRDAVQPKPLHNLRRGTGRTNTLLPGTQREWVLPDSVRGAKYLQIRTDDLGQRAHDNMTRSGWLWLPLAGG